MVYRLDAIKAFGVPVSAEVAQAAPDGGRPAAELLLLLPGPHALQLLVHGGAHGRPALAMLCWMSHFFRRLVGILYVNGGHRARWPHLTFWGRRGAPTALWLT